MDTELAATTGPHHRDPAAAVAVPARPDGVRLARQTVDGAARRAGLSDDCVDNLVIAVSEACTNAIEAQLVAGNSEDIRIRCLVTHGSFVIEIEDRAGPGFDPAHLPSRPPLGDPDHLEIERGWGIQLMRQLVDRLEFVPGPEGSTARLDVGLPA